MGNEMCYTLLTLSVSNIHLRWYHCFISPPSSLKGLVVIFPMRPPPLTIGCLHFLQPLRLVLAYSTQYRASAILTAAASLLTTGGKGEYDVCKLVVGIQFENSTQQHGKFIKGSTGAVEIGRMVRDSAT